MATDRETKGVVTLITKVTYSKPGPDLLQRTRIKSRDESGTVFILSDVEKNVGKRSLFKRQLVDEVKELEKQRKVDYDNEIDNLNEQISEIELL